MVVYRLLKRRERLAGCQTCRFVPRNIDTYYSRLITAIARLPRLSDDDGHRRGEKFVESRRRASCRLVRDRSALRLVVKNITTLMIRRSGQSIVKQDSAIAISWCDAAERCKAWRKAVIISGRIDDGGAGDGPDIRDAGGLVRGYSRAKQVWDSDRSDDQYDGHDDQKLDQRKTARRLPLFSELCVLSNILFPRYERLLKKRGRKFVTSSRPLPYLRYYCKGGLPEAEHTFRFSFATAAESTRRTPVSSMQ